MPLDLEKVESLYDKLEEKVNSTVGKFIDSYSIKESDRATIVSSVINNLVSTSVSATQQQQLNESQITSLSNEDSIKTAQSAKDLLVKDKEIALKTQQITSLSNEDTRANAINAKDILLKQSQTDLANIELSINQYKLSTLLPIEKDNLIKDGTIKTNQGNLITRQTAGYDDNLRVEEAKCLTNVIAGYGFNGTVVDSGLQTTALNAINAITL